MERRTSAWRAQRYCDQNLPSKGCAGVVQGAGPERSRPHEGRGDDQMVHGPEGREEVADGRFGRDVDGPRLDAVLPPEACSLPRRPAATTAAPCAAAPRAIAAPIPAVPPTTTMRWPAKAPGTMLS